MKRQQTDSSTTKRSKNWYKEGVHKAAYDKADPLFKADIDYNKMPYPKDADIHIPSKKTVADSTYKSKTSRPTPTFKYGGGYNKAQFEADVSENKKRRGI